MLTPGNPIDKAIMVDRLEDHSNTEVKDEQRRIAVGDTRHTRLWIELLDIRWVPGQFVAGQFVADNSS